MLGFGVMRNHEQRSVTLTARKHIDALVAEHLSTDARVPHASAPDTPDSSRLSPVLPNSSRLTVRPDVSGFRDLEFQQPDIQCSTASRPSLGVPFGLAPPFHAFCLYFMIPYCVPCTRYMDASTGFIFRHLIPASECAPVD